MTGYDYANIGPTLRRFGYPVFPVRGKLPAVEGWREVPITEQQVRAWAANGSAECNVGVRTGDTTIGHALTMADIDIYDLDVARAVAASVEQTFGTTLERRGKAPKRGLIYAMPIEAPFRKVTSPTWIDEQGVEHRVEWLGDGQQFVAFGIHPDTQKPYTWRDEKSLLNTEPWELPEVTEEAVVAWMNDVLPALIPATWKVKSGLGGEARVRHSQTANMSREDRALMNMKAPLDISMDDLSAAVRALDPDMGHDEWVKVGMAIHHQTRGSDEGFALWDEWSSGGESYKAREVKAKWRSFKDDASRGAQVTFATVLRMTKAAAKAREGDKSSNDFNGDVTALFDDVVLRAEDVRNMAEAEFLIPNMIVRGHVAAFVAPGNGGKTAVFMNLSERLASMGLNVMYINVDGSPGDLKHHYSHASRHGYTVIAPDARHGKSAKDVLEKLRTIAEGNSPCGDYVFIIDTLKKFVDVIDKRSSKELYKMMRSLSVRGATICLLGHTNKYTGDDGKAVFEGTADLRNDLDELIYLDSFKNEAAGRLEITTRPDKVRAEFKPISFVVDLENDRKVTQLDAAISIFSKEERELVDLIKGAIEAGSHSQKDIIAWVKPRVAVSDKRIRDCLVKHPHTSQAEFQVRNAGRAKDLHYSLISVADEFAPALA